MTRLLRGFNNVAFPTIRHLDQNSLLFLSKIYLCRLYFLAVRMYFLNGDNINSGEPGNSVRIVAGRPADRGSIPGRGERIFPLASVSRPALGSTQPPVQWVPGVLSPGEKRGRGVTLTTHPHLVPRSRMSRSYTSSPLKLLHGV
jgi:hypothetical protein